MAPSECTFGRPEATDGSRHRSPDRDHRLSTTANCMPVLHAAAGACDCPDSLLCVPAFKCPVGRGGSYRCPGPNQEITVAEFSQGVECKVTGGRVLGDQKGRQREKELWTHMKNKTHTLDIRVSSQCWPLPRTRSCHLLVMCKKTTKLIFTFWGEYAYLCVFCTRG